MIVVKLNLFLRDNAVIFFEEYQEKSLLNIEIFITFLNIFCIGRLKLLYVKEKKRTILRGYENYSNL